MRKDGHARNKNTKPHTEQADRLWVEFDEHAPIFQFRNKDKKNGKNLNYDWRKPKEKVTL